MNELAQETWGSSIKENKHNVVFFNMIESLLFSFFPSIPKVGYRFDSLMARPSGSCVITFSWAMEAETRRFPLSLNKTYQRKCDEVNSRKY